jgi:signal peptidase I
MIAFVKRIFMFLGSAVLTFVVLVALSPILLVPFGFKTATVMSGSMTPTIRTGDIVIERPIEPGAARIGDVVTFADPDNKDQLLTHRVRHIKVKGDEYTFITRGDANNTAEKWHIKASGTIGRVTMAIPKLGYILGHQRGPWLRLAFVVIPAMVWACYELVQIWKPKEPLVEPKPVAARGRAGMPPPPPPLPN